MKIFETAKKILGQGYVCDNCLGRQFGNILSGYTNKERGQVIRLFLAMEFDNSRFRTDVSNFHGIRFHMSPVKTKSPGKCSICNGLFKDLDTYAKKAAGKMKRLEFGTFLVGTRLSDDLAIREESLWERAGIKNCESLKSEINRETGKIIEKETGKEFEEKRPDVSLILNLSSGNIEVAINPLFVYGRYNKLVRGIPQTKWEKYRETVEDIIAKPFMKATKGGEHSLHAMGREDIDARCLGWRPFILEITGPKKRKIDLERMKREVNRTKKVRIRNLRISSKREVVNLKEKQPDKVYRVVVGFGKPVDGIEKVKKVRGLIKQKTPRRVLHRRANRTRNKKIKSIKWKRINRRKYQFEIRTQAGVYVKELVSGDDGRTKPSISGILENPAKVETLDVIKVMAE